MVKKRDVALFVIYLLAVFFFMAKITQLPLILAYVILNPAYLIIIGSMTGLSNNKIKGFLASILVIFALDLPAAPRILTPIPDNLASNPVVELNLGYMLIKILPFSFEVNAIIVYLVIPALLIFGAYKLLGED